MKPFSILLLLLAFNCSLLAADRPNVLFISLDDMNDWLGCYGGHPDAKTPNIDRLAKRGVRFTNAHCVSPICGPSRASVLTGMRPETTGVYHNRGTYIDYVPNAVTFPEHFRANGYRALAAGKVNHNLGAPDPRLWDANGPDCGVLGTPFIGDELHTATMKPTRRIDRDGLQITLPANGGLSAIDRPLNTWDSFDWAPTDCPETDYPDRQIADWGVEQLGKKHAKPLLLALGFYKPHQPFFAPRKYFDLYDAENVRLPATIAGDLNDVPAPGRELATRPWTSGTHETVTEHGAWREATHAYLATVSFVDALVGRILKALDEGPHADNTWIVLWSDHGWSLGEKEHWGKHVPWREGVQMPLIIVPPKNSRLAKCEPGSTCDAPVSLLDLYPTLIDACGLPEREELEGRTLTPLLANVDTKWDQSVVSTIGRNTHSVSSGDWRYIRYFDGSEELYNLKQDPREWSNVAAKSKHAKLMRQFARHIPEDADIRQTVGWGRWKCVFPTKGEPMLFDYQGRFGISEQFDVTADNPEVVADIRTYLRANKITAPRVAIPERSSPFLRWSELPPLPGAFGFGGPIAGTDGGALIVAGGANFPDGPPWPVGDTPAGGKVWHDRIHVLESASNNWKVAGRLPNPLAYAPAISTVDGIYVLGGEKFDGKNGPTADVIRLNWNPETESVVVTENALAPLPEACHYHNAALMGSVIYVAASHAKDDNSRKLDSKSFWSLDLADRTRRWRELTPWPGAPRQKMAMAVSSGRLYLISGATWAKNERGENDLKRFELFTDAYCYDPAEAKWTRIADLPVVSENRPIKTLGYAYGPPPMKWHHLREGEPQPSETVDATFRGQPRPAGASAAIGVGDSQIILLSGATGRFITMDIHERPFFPREVLGYDTRMNTWKVIDQMPVGVVTTSAVKWNDKIVIPSGEIRPGVRTPKVQTATVVQ